MGQVGRCPLQTVSVVDLPLARLHVNIEVLEVVVEVHGPGTEMSSQQGGVGGEHRGHLHLPEPQHDQGDPRHPLVEMSHNLGVLLTTLGDLPPEVGNELGHHEAEDDEVVALNVEMWYSYLGLLVQLLFPGVQLLAGGTEVEQNHRGIPLHQPSPYLHPPALISTYLTD